MLDVTGVAIWRLRFCFAIRPGNLGEPGEKEFELEVRSKQFDCFQQIVVSVKIIQVRMRCQVQPANKVVILAIAKSCQLIAQ